MRTERGLLWLRAGLLTLVVLVGSGAAHVAGGGRLPSGSDAFGVIGLAGLLSVAMLGVEVPHRLIGARVVATTVVGQVAVHLALMAATPPVEHQSMQHMTGMAHAMPADHGPMLLAHTAAAALIGLWLAAGERALLTLLAALAWRDPGLDAPGAPPVLSTRRWHAPATAPTCQAYVLRHVRRRGPPALLAL